MKQSTQMYITLTLFICFSFLSTVLGFAKETPGPESRKIVSTFSIVARDSAAGELGVAVASKFFAVGNVVPWARADVGAVATQSFANTTFGWRGLDLLEQGANPDEVVEILTREDDQPEKRQFGIVAADGQSATFTGAECVPWVGGRSGENYAVQGNILAGEDVVIAMEAAFLDTEGTLADKLYAALTAGESKGGDARGKQSAAMLVMKEGAGYGGYTDRAIDIRVDDHAEPFKELGRLLNFAQMNYAWNEAWTLFTQQKYEAALPPMERTVRLAPENGEVWYDLAVIRAANNRPQEALNALDKATKLNPKLKKQAKGDADLESVHSMQRFRQIVEDN
jgi:uncharacterized Ntn-hydrolase superfamily protein